MRIWQRLYDYVKWFKVIITGINKSNLWVRYIVKPYKIIENRNFVFDNSYIIEKCIKL